MLPQSDPREVSSDGRLAIIELALVGDVIERIDMGVAVAMARHAEEAHAE